MEPRGGVRRLVVAALAGALLGGGLMAVTPAGAEVQQAVATNWRKIWKQELQPKADRRYYTKKKSDARYYTKRASDGRYEALGSGYTKAESDAKYAKNLRTVTGVYAVSGYAEAQFDQTLGSISFGRTLPNAPQVVVIQPGNEPPAGCSGSVTDPQASPGYLCIFTRPSVNEYSSGPGFTSANYCATPDPSGCVPYASRLGLYVIVPAQGPGVVQASGSWALGLPAGT